MDDQQDMYSTEQIEQVSVLLDGHYLFPYADS